MDPDGVVLQGLLLHELGATLVAEISVGVCRKDNSGHSKLVWVYLN